MDDDNEEEPHQELIMANDTLKTGTTLQNGKYRIIKVLGNTFFNITYLADHVFLKQYVAIKINLIKKHPKSSNP